MALGLAPCRKCGIPFSGKYCKPCSNARSAARRAADPKAAAAAVTAWKKKNPERVKQLNALSYRRTVAQKKEYAKRYRKINKQRIIEYNANWAKANPDKVKQKMNRHDKKGREELSDKYLASIARLPRAQIPTTLLEAMRVSIQIKRFLKEKP